MSMRVYYATDIHGSEVCWRKFLNAGRFYNADVLILGGDITGKAVVPVVAAAGGGHRVRQFSGDRVLDADELAATETRIRDMGFYPYRTTEDELEAVWDNPEAVNEVFLGLMRSTLVRWLDLATERLAGTGIRLYAMEGNDDPPELYGMLRDANVLTETEDRLVDLGEGITMISYGYSNPTPWHTPRELDDDELERRIDKLAAQVSPAGARDLQPARAARPHGHRQGPGARRLAQADRQGRRRGDAVGRLGGRPPADRQAPADARAARAHPRVPRRDPARPHPGDQPGQ